MAHDISLIHSDEYANWVLTVTQGRRFMNAKDRLYEMAEQKNLSISEVLPRPATPEELAIVHSEDYINEVRSGFSGEWYAQRFDLSDLAQLMAGGTIVALDELVSGKTKLAVNFAGAKHHAQHSYSSGFCVFADLAMAATMLTRGMYGDPKRVAVFDFDVHHGDGTENLLRDNPLALTYSVHEYGIFPGTGGSSSPKDHVYNLPLRSGQGDRELMIAVREFLAYVGDFGPDYVFIAGGADGHKLDPLGSIEYSFKGYDNAMHELRAGLPNMPILYGGAGGYLPDDVTPKVWATAVAALAEEHKAYLRG
jgi:acetoin utilization protein AcuC